MATIILIIHLMLAVALVATVLLQRSEGGALGIGGGGDGMMTGRGAGNVLTRATAVLAALFMTNEPGAGHPRGAGRHGGQRARPRGAADRGQQRLRRQRARADRLGVRDAPKCHRPKTGTRSPPTAPAEAPTDANADESPAAAPEPAEPAVPRAE